ncbi:protein of unknown function [Alcaligenes faecalis subsp. faecalis]|nr:protein of unknown function [Alcaligenes faecalis subsp. faecalis]
MKHTRLYVPSIYRVAQAFCHALVNEFKAVPPQSLAGS